MKTKKYAVFIDYENISVTLRKHYLQIPTDTEIGKQLKENLSKAYGELLIVNAYRDWARDDRTRDAQRDLDRQGIKCVQVTPTRGGKDRSDPEIIVDVMETINNRKDIDGFIIVAGDGDYKRLIRYIREKGKDVIICALSLSLNADLAAEVKTVLALDNWLSVKPVTGFQGFIAELASFENWAQSKNTFVGLKNFTERAKSFQLGCEDTIQSKVSRIHEAANLGILEVYEAPPVEGKVFRMRAIRLIRDNSIVSEVLKKLEETP